MTSQEIGLGAHSKPLKMSSRLVGTFGLKVGLPAVVNGVALWGMGAMRASTVETTPVGSPASRSGPDETTKSEFRPDELRHILVS